MAKRPIHYEPHPVSRERKAELIAQGFSIIDAKFKPKEAAPEEPVEPLEELVAVVASQELADAAPVRRKPGGRKPKASL